MFLKGNVKRDRIYCRVFVPKEQERHKFRNESFQFIRFFFLELFMHQSEKEPMLNHSRVGGGAEESPAPPPVRNRRQSAIDRAARLVDITHHTVVHVSADIAVAGDVVRSPEKTGNGSQGTTFVAKMECPESPGNQNSNA